MYFCTSLILVFATAALINQRQTPQPSINEEQRNEILHQEQIFMEWYENYQKDIDQLDRNWQLYHNTLANFKMNNIDAEEFYERMKRLEETTRVEQVNIHKLQPPEEIGMECKQILNQVIKKTQIYVDAQTQTISLTKDAAAPENLHTENHDEQVRLFQEIMIRESPAGLFTSSEISTILDYFYFPPESDGRLTAE